MQLQFLSLFPRHIGVGPGQSATFGEAARVCLSKHHQSPSTFKLTDNGMATSSAANWQPPDVILRNAWNNDTDATEQGACAIALAAIDLTRGLVAIRRAETKSGADFYLGKPGQQVDDLETSYRLEISGIDRDDRQLLGSRLRKKLRQLKKGLSNLPAIAVVVGFSTLNVLAEDVE